MGGVGLAGRGFGGETRRLARASTPPEHEFQSESIGVGAGNPATQTLEVGGESLDEFLLGAAERWPFLVSDHVMDGQELPARAEPTCDGFRVEVSVLGRDGAEQGVFEDPVERGEGGHSKEVALAEGSRQCLESGAFGGESKGGGGDIEAGGYEAVACPGADVVAGAATGNQHGAAGKVRSVAQEVDEAGGAFAFFPGDVAGSIPCLPCVVGHDGVSMTGILRWGEVGRRMICRQGGRVISLRPSWKAT